MKLSSCEHPADGCVSVCPPPPKGYKAHAKVTTTIPHPTESGNIRVKGEGYGWSLVSEAAAQEMANENAEVEAEKKLALYVNRTNPPVSRWLS